MSQITKGKKIMMEDLFDSDEDFEFIHGRITSRPQNSIKKKRKTHKPDLTPVESPEEIGGNDFSAQNFDFQYSASRYEEGWLIESLGGFFEQHWIKDVTRIIKGGKEASVYQCLAGDGAGVEYLAAKVYRPRKFRNLKNDLLYRQSREYLDENGHAIHDARMNHAIQKKSSYGKKLTHISWIEHEFHTMNLLFDAGADIPKPYTSANNAILMDFVGGPDMGAPALNEINLPLRLAQRTFDRIIFNIELMLSVKRIHADLSAYNVLFWDDKLAIIDFPQAIDPLHNPNAWQIFKRDITRVCQYFARQKLDTNPDRLAIDLWRKHRLSGSENYEIPLTDSTEELHSPVKIMANAGGLGL